jgi:type IV pilus assembly protein PilC
MALRTYRYKLITDQGKIIRGILLAPQGQNVGELIDHHHNHLLKVRQLSLVESFLTNPRISDQDLLNLTSQCYQLLKAGVGIQDIIRILSISHASTFIHSSLTQIWRQLQSGEKLSQALRAHPFLFDSLYCHTIQVGEQQGTLIDAFKELVSHLSKRVELKRKLRQSTVYPAILAMIMLILVMSLSLFLLPQLKDFIQSFGFELTLSTRLLLWLGEIIERFGFLFCTFMIVFVLSIRVLHFLSERFAHHFDRGLLKLPFLGEILILYNITQYLIDFRIFCNDGRAVVKALQEAPSAVTNHCLNRQLQWLSQKVHEGGSLTDLFLTLPWFPEAVVQMIKVGETSGQLTQALVFCEEFVQSALWSKIERYLRLVEPLLLIVMGGFLLWIVIAVFLPLYDHVGAL